MSNTPSRRAALAMLGASTIAPSAFAAPSQRSFRIARAAYADRVAGIWYGQMLGVFLTLRFEHKTAAVAPINSFPRRFENAFVDDDWYYEMCAVRAFERYGIDLTADQLGQQWLDNNCGAWGSSREALINLKRGIKGSLAGHPRYNKFWWTIGPVFSADLYGAIAPAMPNIAGIMARRFGHINGYGEAVDGAVIWAGAISLAFVERDVRTVLQSAIQLVDASSPYRQCLELVVRMASAGASFEAVVEAVETNWRHRYPQSNNAVPNGGIAAASLWFGSGDFWATINLASRAADFTDTDNSAASAIAVIGAMKGMAALPPELVAQLGDRVVGTENNDVPFTPPVDEKISDLARRTVAIGERLAGAHGGTVRADILTIARQTPVAQAQERFLLSDLMRYWAADWTLVRAGFGGIRGSTHLDGDTLATYPEDEARGLAMTHVVNQRSISALDVEVGVDSGRAWQLRIYADNRKLYEQIIEGSSGERKFRKLRIDLKAYARAGMKLRLYQTVHDIGERTPGTAFWRNLNIS